MKLSKIFAAVSAVALAAVSMVSLQASAADEFTAYLAGQAGGNQCWSISDVPSGSITPTVNGDAQYEISWNVENATATIEFLMINIPELASFNYPDLSITVDSVTVDGKELSYTQSAASTDYAYCDNSNPNGSTRVYLLNTWVGTSVTDVPQSTAIEKNITVRFTVSGMGVAGTSNIVPTVVTTTTAAGGATTTVAGGATTTAAGGATTTTAGGATTDAGAATTTAAAASSATGVEGVASVVALLTIAGAAVVIAKKH